MAIIIALRAVRSIVRFGLQRGLVLCCSNSPSTHITKRRSMMMFRRLPRAHVKSFFSRSPLHLSQDAVMLLFSLGAGCVAPFSLCVPLLASCDGLWMGSAYTHRFSISSLHPRWSFSCSWRGSYFIFFSSSFSSDAWSTSGQW